jgi:hypothetical protein
MPDCPFFLIPLWSYGRYADGRRSTVASILALLAGRRPRQTAEGGGKREADEKEAEHCLRRFGTGYKRTMATMDAERLHVVLQQSFSPDVNLRGPAEEIIRNLKHLKGATTLLLKIAAEKQVSIPQVEDRKTRSPRVDVNNDPKKKNRFCFHVLVFWWSQSSSNRCTLIDP